jgi:hypothetical protein
MTNSGATPVEFCSRQRGTIRPRKRNSLSVGSKQGFASLEGEIEEIETAEDFEIDQRFRMTGAETPVAAIAPQKIEPLTTPAASMRATRLPLCIATPMILILLGPGLAAAIT